MIVVNRYNGGISVKGHANYAPHGHDIVCAGISTLTQTLIASIEQLTADEIQYVIQPGTVDIKFGDLSDETNILIDSFFVGVQAIANAYPENVLIE